MTLSMGGYVATLLRRRFCLHMRGMNALVCGFRAYDEYVILEGGYKLID
jgi:hypothetical protein